MITNYVTSVKKLKLSETPPEKEGLVGLESEIAMLDALIKAEIERHRDCMADLTQRSVLAKRQLNSQVPFARLPVEVVTTIFLLACSEDSYYKPSTPLRIGSICHDWRTIAWSSSELWSFVTVCLEVQEEASKIQANLLSNWLLRAGKRPLSITVTIREEDKDWWDALRAVDSALSLVLSYSERWRSLDLLIPRVWQHFLDGFQGNTPILEHLTLRSEIGSSEDGVFWDVPQLRSVTFDGLNPMYLERLPFPWRQMTKLQIEWRDLQECLGVVEQCSSLARLVLVERRPPFPPDASTVTAPTLINLEGLTSLHVTSEATFCSIMDCLLTPNLEDVEVCFAQENDDFFRSLRALISRSACEKSITRLSFTGFIFSEKEMMAFLAALQNLSQLELDNDEHAPSFSRIFTDTLHSPGSASRGLLLPNLVSVKYAGPITLDTHGFLDLLDARCNVGDAPKLKSVLVHGYDKAVKKSCDLPQTQLLRAKGIVVDIKYLDPELLPYQGWCEYTVGSF